MEMKLMLKEKLTKVTRRQGLDDGQHRENIHRVHSFCPLSPTHIHTHMYTYIEYTQASHKCT